MLALIRMMVCKSNGDTFQWLPAMAMIERKIILTITSFTAMSAGGGGVVYSGWGGKPLQQHQITLRFGKLQILEPESNQSSQTLLKTISISMAKTYTQILSGLNIFKRQGKVRLTM